MHRYKGVTPEVHRRMPLSAKVLSPLEKWNYWSQRRNSRAPFVPPKPNEFDIAYSTSAFLEWLGT